MPRVMSMDEFKAGKRAMQAKWGEKLIQHTPAERAEQEKEALPLAKYTRLHVEKFLWALGKDWQERQAGRV